MTARIVFTAALLLGVSGSAGAQTTGAAASGPLVIERIESQFVVAPEYKFTEVGGRTGHMAGVSAGVLTDKSLYLGGAVYFLTNGDHDFGLTYGGLLTGWTAPVGTHLRVGGRGLFGFGGATLGNTFTMFDPRGRMPRSYRYVFHDDFVFAEPQAQAHVSFADHVGVDVTAGYRFTGWEDALNEDINGVTGAVAVQLGW